MSSVTHAAMLSSDRHFYCLSCCPTQSTQRSHSGGPSASRHLACAKCGRLLETTLTEAGIRLVLDVIVEWLNDGPSVWNTLMYTKHGNTGYYSGHREVEVARDLAVVLLEDYELPSYIRGLLDYFIFVTRLASNNPACMAKDRKKEDASKKRSVARLPGALVRAMGGLPPVKTTKAKTFNRYGHNVEAKNKPKVADTVDVDIFEMPGTAEAKKPEVKKPEVITGDDWEKFKAGVIAEYMGGAKVAQVYTGQVLKAPAYKKAYDPLEAKLDQPPGSFYGYDPDKDPDLSEDEDEEAEAEDASLEMLDQPQKTWDNSDE